MRRIPLRFVLAIIGTAWLLAGCSATRLAYNHAPQLAWWWIDRQFDFNADQATPVQERIERWFAWHRQTQLLDYAAFLAQLRLRAGEKVGAEQVCAWSEAIGAGLRPAYARGFELAAEVAPLLQGEQLRHLERHFAKDNAEFREKYLQSDVAERRRASLRRAVDNAERFYGRLDPAQQAWLEQVIAESPFDPAAWLADRQRRQREVLALLREWQQARPDRAAMVAGMQRVADRAARSPDPDYRRYQQRLAEFNCRATAELHNRAGTRQREALREQLLEWEGDLRALASQASP